MKTIDKYKSRKPWDFEIEGIKPQLTPEQAQEENTKRRLKDSKEGI